MTAQEAIEKIKYRIHTANEIVGKGSDDVFRDLNLAIEALEKQVSLDRIIERLEERVKYYDGLTKEYLEKEFDVLAQANSCRAHAFEKAIEIVKEEGVL